MSAALPVAGRPVARRSTSVAIRTWERAVIRPTEPLIHREMSTAAGWVPATFGEGIHPGERVVAPSSLDEVDVELLCERCFPRNGALRPGDDGR
jgi:hypothetical protein